MKSEGQLFHAVHWGEFSKLEIDLLSAQLRQDGSRLLPIAESSYPALIDFFSQYLACVIGNEEGLQAATAEGRTTVPVALWEATDSNLPWLPCHRVLRDVEWYQSGWMVCLAREHMFFRDVTALLMSGHDAGSTLNLEIAEQLLLPQNSDETVTLLAISNDGAWRIHAEAGWADGLLQGLHPALRETAVLQLHSIILPRGLSLSSEDGSQDKRVDIVNSTGEAIAALDHGAQVIYLLRPVDSAKLQELVQHGQMLPAKSVALDIAALEAWIDAE